MAIPQVLKAQIEEVDLIIERFSKLNKPLVFNENTSLATLIAKRTQLNDAIDNRNAKATEFSESIVQMNDSDKDLIKNKSSFLVQVGQVYGKDSDEYVWAGGTRQSESLEKAKNTRLEKAKTKNDPKI